MHFVLAQDQKGFADRSYGIHVAQLAGLPKPVIAKAKELLNKLEKDSIKSGKKVLKDESHNMDLFMINTASEENKKLYDEMSKIDPDKLSPREALDIIYFLKSTFNIIINFRLEYNNQGSADTGFFVSAEPIRYADTFCRYFIN